MKCSFFFHFFRCSEHSIVDVCMYDNNTMAVLLQEETGDNVPVLALLSLSSVPGDQFTPIPPVTDHNSSFSNDQL